MTAGDGPPNAEYTDQSEFADYDGALLPYDPQFGWSRLLTPAALRGFAALVGGLVFLFTDRSTGALAVILAAVVIWWGLSEFTSPSEDRRSEFVSAAALLALGAALLLWPDLTGRMLSRLLGSAVIFFGARDIYRAFRSLRTGGETHRWWVIRGAFVVSVGLSLWVAPGVMLDIVIAVFATFWVITGIATAVANFTTTGADVEVTEVWFRIFTWLDQRPHSADDRSQLYEKLFFEGERAARRLSRFFLLMGFATTIAAFGIVSDSTAVVIGAMLVAPLMTPLMGTSLSLIMGWPVRATMSAGVAVGGIALAIGLSAVFAGMLPFELDPATNSQVASRVAPTMVDLIIAIAAGGAGAFALSRPDVSDALPGVAVAIALVPPLAVVGLMLAGGHGHEAFGAFMLFTTNMLAILVIGALVFLLTGVVPIRKIVAQREWVRNTSALLGVLALLVVVVLGTTTEQIRAEAFDRDNIEAVVDEWIGARALDTVGLSIDSSAIEIIVIGPDRPDDVERLVAELESELDRPLEVTVRWVPEERFTVGAERD